MTANDRNDNLRLCKGISSTGKALFPLRALLRRSAWSSHHQYGRNDFWLLLIKMYNQTSSAEGKATTSPKHSLDSGQLGDPRTGY